MKFALWALAALAARAPRQALASLTLVIVTAALFGGCEGAACVPGHSVACSTGECTGHQVCEEDGESYGECLCGTPDSGEFPNTGPNSGLIGAACEGSTDCREGFDCLTADSTLIAGQGPSAGVCLAKCLPEHDFCTSFDARSKCIVLYDGGTASNLDDLAYCLPGCVLGTQPNEMDKCRGRIDLVCAESPAGAGVGFCRPACRSDLDCGSRFCDLSTGLCGDEPRTGNDIGESCGAQGASCAGGCLDHGASYSECSGVCRYGTPGCGQVDQSLPLDYFCLLDPTSGSGEGDLGYCTRLCDCDDDCGRPDAVCQPNEDLEESTGRSGSCGSINDARGNPRPNTPC
jgi:hypothetical protein